MADTQEMSNASISRFVHRIAYVITSLAQDYIKFPGPEDARHLATDFMAIAGMPGVIGCIDGSLVRIVSPGGNNAELYRCRKGFLALNVMAVCDAKMRFINLISSWPGSVHDSRIFNNSRICQKLQDRNYSGYLLGDSGYACRPYLLTPLLEPQTEKQQRYNAAHIRTRDTIERCFGMWKRRFAILNHLRTKLETSKRIIIATAVLHNFAVNTGVPLPEVGPEPDAAVPDQLAYEVPAEATGQAVRAAVIDRWF